MGFREALLGDKLLFFDGAMGTMLQSAGLQPGECPETWNLTHADSVRNIHKEYARVGADILMTNTFGCTESKLSGITPEDAAAAATRIAREAAKGGAFVALDVGPTGKLLRPIGDLAFEEAVRQFTPSIQAGCRAGADLVIIETFSDMYELKAAVLAAKECCGLPVLATVVMDARGKMLTGGDVDAVVALLEGLRVDALGLNCGLGPAQMMPLLHRMRAVCSLPIVLNPNAGLPHEEDGNTVFDVRPEAFAAQMRQAAEAGARLLGGCCGTTPAHIAALRNACAGIQPAAVEKKTHTVIASYSRAVAFQGGPVLIGERINPTGKPRMKQALRDKDMDHVLREGIIQQQNGAMVLDVNAGLPEIDEVEVLASMVQQLQSVTDLPLQLDSADPAALERAMRLYNGKPMINSVNGKRESMDAVFPLVQKYGGLVVALTLDESGIPETAEGRVAVAERIIARAAEFGIDKKDIIADTLTMTISSGGENANITLEALRRVKAELNVKTTLGVSNVSFGLPRRDLLNACFFALAIEAGLDAAILNPNDSAMMDMYHSALAITGKDAQCGAYIARHAADPAGGAPKLEPTDITLYDAVRQGLRQRAQALAQQALKQNEQALDIIHNGLVPALNEVGIAFEKGTLFLPQLLMSAEAAKAAFEVVRSALGDAAGETVGCVVIATVEGDVHDIGKNIVKALLSNYRFDVVDLGRDVPAETVLHAAKERGASLVGLSALMTTTVPSMQRAIGLLKKEMPACRIMVGGAVLTEEYAAMIGADKYCRDAMSSVRYAQEVYGVQE